MDSKLVVEQMSGNWKVKHPSMKPLAARGEPLAPAGTTYTWVPRAENAARRPAGQRGARRRPTPPRVQPEARRRPRAEDGRARLGTARRAPTTLVLVRHGVTDAHPGKLLLRRPGQQQPAAQRRGPRAGPGHGGVAGADGRHVRRAGQLAGTAHPRDRGDPRRVPRPRDRGGARHRRDGVRHLGRAELHRGARAVPRRARLLAGRPRVGAARRRVVPGGARSGCWRAATGSWRRTPGRTVVAVSHVTPIKTLVADALGAPLEAVYRMELAPASVTVISYFRGGPDGDIPMANLRLYNGARPTSSADVRLRSELVDDHVELVAVRAGSPSSTFQPRSRDHVGERARASRGGAALQQRAHEPALGRLVEVADHLALRRRPAWSTRTVATLRARSGLGPPERGVGGGAQVDDQTRRRQPRARRGRARRASARRPHRGPGRLTPPASRYDGIRSPGRTRPNSDEMTASERVARRRAAASSEARSRRVVEHAGVDRVGAAVGAVEQARVAAYVVGLGGTEPERSGRRGRGRRAQVDQRVEDPFACGGQGRESSGRPRSAAAPRRAWTCPPRAAAGSAPRQPRGPWCGWSAPGWRTPADSHIRESRNSLPQQAKLDPKLSVVGARIHLMSSRPDDTASIPGVEGGAVSRPCSRGSVARSVGWATRCGQLGDAGELMGAVRRIEA